MKLLESPSFSFSKSKIDAIRYLQTIQTSNWLRL